jgi:hypothetical protein
MGDWAYLEHAGDRNLIGYGSGSGFVDVQMVGYFFRVWFGSFPDIFCRSRYVLYEQLWCFGVKYEMKFTCSSILNSRYRVQL